MKDRLQVSQNKIIRYMLHVPPRTHIGVNEFKRVNLLPVHYRVEQLKLGHMYNILNGNAPVYMSCNINMVQNTHSHGTRVSFSSCMVPRVEIFGSKSFYYTSICHWNDLPLSIKQCTSKDNFKKSIKAHLRNKVINEDLDVYIRS